MGCIAKSDGVVTRREIDVAEHFMRQMQLNPITESLLLLQPLIKGNRPTLIWFKRCIAYRRPVMISLY